MRFGVRADDPRSLERLAEFLPPGTAPLPNGVVERLYSIRTGAGGVSRRGLRRFQLLYADHLRLARTVDIEELFERFESDLQLFVAASSKRWVFIHAGVVGWRGRAILVPGRSLSGKTTLVGELVRAGAEYYSDEYAVLDGRGRVRAYPKLPSVREGGAFRQRKVSLEEFGAAASGAGPLPVGLVVLSGYRGGASWRPRELSAGRAALEMLGHAVAARLQPERVLAALSGLPARARVLKGERGEAVETARRVLEEASN